MFSKRSAGAGPYQGVPEYLIDGAEEIKAEFEAAIGSEVTVTPERFSWIGAEREGGVEANQHGEGIMVKLHGRREDTDMSWVSCHSLINLEKLEEMTDVSIGGGGVIARLFRERVWLRIPRGDINKEVEIDIPLSVALSLARWGALHDRWYDERQARRWSR